MNYFSRGKLLITGEYLVLKGATALAVPLVRGQILSVEETTDRGVIEWHSLEYNKEWFFLSMNTTVFDILDTTDKQVAERLRKMLVASRRLNPLFLSKDKGYKVVTDMDFKKEWGFGSSSTLIANLARWAGVNPFALHRKVSKGSGYDVIAALKEGPFFFTLQKREPVVETVSFNPPFKDRIFFIYTGRKQNSEKSIQPFLQTKKQYRTEKRTISELSGHMAKADMLSDFEYYVKEHNLILSSILKVPEPKQNRFSDLLGEIKPLGAWGGDFAMMTWNDDPANLKLYLENKNIKTFFTFNELIKYSETTG